MIKFRDDLIMNNTGIVYKTMIDTARAIYENDPMRGGEYALSALELALSGDCSTSDFDLNMMLNPFKFMADRNISKLESRREKQDSNRIEKMQLREIAELYQRGVKQTDIAKQLNTSRQTISNRIKIIQQEFPELLKTETVPQQELQGEYLGGTIKISELNRSSLDYDVVDNFAYFPSTGVRLKIIPDD